MVDRPPPPSLGPDELQLDREDLEIQEELRKRVNRAIALAASELESLDMSEQDLRRQEILQRAHVQVQLLDHEAEEAPLRREAEHSLAGLQQAEQTFLSFAVDVDRLDLELKVRVAQGETEMNAINTLVTHQTQHLADGREHLKEVHAKDVKEVMTTAQMKVNSATGDGLAKAHAQIAELRHEVVHTRFKNAIRLKKMQNESHRLAAHLMVADIGAAALKAELEHTEIEMHGARAAPLHMQTGVQMELGGPMMPVEVAAMQQLHENLAGLATALEEIGFREVAEAAVHDALQGVHDEAKSRGNTVTEAAAIIHMLRAENASRKKKLEKELAKHDKLKDKHSKLKDEHQATKRKVTEWCDKHEEQRIRGDKAEAAGRKAVEQAAAEVRELTAKLEARMDGNSAKSEARVTELEEARHALRDECREAKEMVAVLEARLQVAEDAKDTNAAEHAAAMRAAHDAHKTAMAAAAEEAADARNQLMARHAAELKATHLVMQSELHDEELAYVEAVCCSPIGYCASGEPPLPLRIHFREHGVLPSCVCTNVSSGCGRHDFVGRCSQCARGCSRKCTPGRSRTPRGSRVGVYGDGLGRGAHQRNLCYGRARRRASRDAHGAGCCDRTRS